MDTSAQIPLNNNWLCEYFQQEPALNEPPESTVMVPSLIDWRRGEHQKRAGFAELQRSVYLEPTEVCISYVLHIDSAPGKVVLNVNGRRLGHFDGRQPFTFDITDYVALEDNTIVLRVDCSARGRFGAIYLEQMPCE